MMQEIYILDLIGTFAFAIYGSYFALRKNFDIFGIFVSAFITAVGGGTLRELILNRSLFYFYDMNYLLMVVIGVIFTVIIYKKFHKIKTFALFLDSVGLVTFAFIGASKASELGLGVFAITFIAVITAVGGGVLRDLILDKTPTIMHNGFYASVAIFLGLIYGFSGTQMENAIWANLLLFLCLVIRGFVIIYKINLWKPSKLFSFWWRKECKYENK